MGLGKHCFGVEQKTVDTLKGMTAESEGAGSPEGDDESRAKTLIPAPSCPLGDPVSFTQ